jgi:hypothetical protein
VKSLILSASLIVAMAGSQPWAQTAPPNAGRVSRIEILQGTALKVPIGADHVHFFAPETHLAGMRDWVANITDPWGTYIELSEGLDKF